MWRMSREAAQEKNAAGRGAARTGRATLLSLKQVACLLQKTTTLIRINATIARDYAEKRI